MAVGHFQISVPFAPDLPENVVVSNLYLNDVLPNEFPGTTDWSALADSVAQVWETSFTGGAGTKKITVKVYNAAGPGPHDPLVTRVRNPTATPLTPAIPTQIALCLSFKGGQRPWQRGRIYLPAFQSSGFAAATSLTARPSQSVRDQQLLLADAIAGIGGVDIQWCVWSRLHQEAFKVTEAWCDDSWDIQRRRKLSPTTRSTRTGLSG